MIKKKKFMAYLATVFLLIASMLIAACGGPSETKKDAAQNGKPIEITDVTGRTVTLKKPAERVVLQWSGAGGPFLTISALMGKDTPKVIAVWIHLCSSIEQICGNTLLRKCLS